MKNNLSLVEIWTDGSVYPNPGPGGWAAILKYKDVEKEITGSDSQTTNNRMEMMGAIQALEVLKRPCQVIIYSDSQYLVKTINHGWRRNMNVDLWTRLDQARKPHRVSFQWVRGHDTDVMNNRADVLAEQARKGKA